MANQPNPFDWISFITSLATLATAIAALLTIREMRAQRRSIYRPEIAFQRTLLNLFWANDKLVGTPLYCTSQQERPSDILESFVALEARNVGLGTGTNLKAKWHFDVNQSIQTLSRLDPKQRFKIWNDKDGRIEFDFEKSTPRMVALRHSVLAHTPYFLPIQISAEPIQISLPWAYVHMFCIWVYLMMEQVNASIDDDQQNAEELPPLDLLLTYSDIGGEKYERKFTVRLELMLHQSDVEPHISEQVAWAQVQVSESV